MTNEELKKKIVEFVLNSEITGIQIRAITGGYSMANSIADALIAAGIGDVKTHRVFVSKDGKEVKQLYSGEEVEQIVKERDEYKHRAEVAERALKKFAENITCEDCPFFSDCASSEKMEDLIHSNYCFAEYLRQAEKELAEEGKDNGKS